MDERDQTIRHLRAELDDWRPTTRRRTMSIVDDIEFFGRAADAGDMPRDAAVRALADASSGGLTLVGAESSIDNWQTARADYKAVYETAADNLRKWTQEPPR
ncbi:hypothetical protein [Streptomyces rubiginosohelvolus]|uniref:hypothetical protein n=1 Tax=Streptomyces rubiginosohelvolus TaxID=67362 RepID=UPI003663836B